MLGVRFRRPLSWNDIHRLINLAFQFIILVGHRMRRIGDMTNNQRSRSQHQKKLWFCYFFFFLPGCILKSYPWNMVCKHYLVGCATAVLSVLSKFRNLEFKRIFTRCHLGYFCCKLFKSDNSKYTGWIFPKFGTLIGSVSAPSWFNFQGRVSKVKFADCDRHMVWLIVDLLPWAAAHIC